LPILNSVPKIDHEIGILVYSSLFPGCGGKIKSSSADFAVSEILSDSTMNSINYDDGYAVYKLKKQNIDTHHALVEIFKKYGLRLKALGLKDSSAVTEQFVCSNNRGRSIEKITEKKFSLQKIGFVKKPLSKKNMIGNNFKIKITGNVSNFSRFNEYEKILNFFGYQRFGSKRPVTHLIGKAIVKREFQNAIDLLLSSTSDYDSPENNALRSKLSDKSNFTKIVQELPRHMDLEIMVIKKIIENDDPLSALHSLPLTIRRLFVQAYQSFIFNKTLSNAFDDGEDLFLPQENDVCYNNDGTLGKYSNDVKQRLAIPMVGYSYYKKTRFHYRISKILIDESVSPKDFFIKEMQEVSSEGGFRNSSILCKDFLIKDDFLSFTLSRGSYATIVLREIMKPEDPLKSGF